MNHIRKPYERFESLKEWSARHPAVSQYFDAPRHVLDQTQLSQVGIDILLRGAEHPNPKVRWSCAHLADHIDDARCFEVLVRLVHDEVPRVRAEALHGLACERCKSCPLPVDAVALLVDAALNDPSDRVRQKMVSTFSFHSPDERIRDALGHIAVHDTNERIRREASRALKYQNG